MGFMEKFMNVVEKVGDTVDKGIDKGMESYSKMAEKSRINKEMKTLNAEIEAILLSVGRKLYAEDCENEKFKADFSEVTSKEATIAELKTQLENLENGVVPASSSDTVAEIEEAAVEIRSADEPQTAEVEVVDAEPANVCPGCGASCVGGAKFCDQCGTKLSD